MTDSESPLSTSHHVSSRSGSESESTIYISTDDDDGGDKSSDSRSAFNSTNYDVSKMDVFEKRYPKKCVSTSSASDTSDDDTWLQRCTPYPERKRKRSKKEEDEEIKLVKSEHEFAVDRNGIARIPVTKGIGVYALLGKALNFWIPAKVLKVLPPDPDELETETTYLVEYEETQLIDNKHVLRSQVTLQDETVPWIQTKQTLHIQHLAFPQPYAGNVPLGERVIAQFTDDFDSENPNNGLFYSCMIAEQMSSLNKDRYLVFYEWGDARYVYQDEVRVICTGVVFKNHFNPTFSEYFKEYVEKYPDIRKINVKDGDIVVVEWNGMWWAVRVEEIDCNMVKISYIWDNKIEWIFRGSLRFRKLYEELYESQKGFKSRNKYSLKQDRCLEYEGRLRQMTWFTPEKCSRIHSLCVCDPIECQLNMSECIQSFNTYLHEGLFRNITPLAVPLKCGFHREKRRDSLQVVYFGPCGVELSSIEEVVEYLHYLHLLSGQEDFQFGIDYFSFDPDLQFNFFEPTVANCRVADLSKGIEKVQIEYVNSLGTEIPEPFTYIVERVEGEDVNLSEAEKVLICCDCKDDCRDSTTCACRQLTLSQSLPQKPDYNFKRLSGPLPHVIFECNRKCSCRLGCHNRVVQNGMKYPVEVFKTEFAGYGLRAKFDMPPGTFIFEILGKLIAPNHTQEVAAQHGDSYFANIGVYELNPEDEHYPRDKDEDSITIDISTSSTSSPEVIIINSNRDFVPTPLSSRLCQSSTSLTSEDSSFVSSENSKDRVDNEVLVNGVRATSDSDDDDDSDEAMSTNSKSDERSDMSTTSSRHSVHDSDVLASSPVPVAPLINSNLPLRERLQNTDTDKESDENSETDEQTVIYVRTTDYLLDLIDDANVARFVNHACDANTFPQNVFVNCHDPRFPQVGLFTRKFIKAGTELTWNYHYSLKNDENEAIQCRCKTRKCGGRLL